ncbi:DUF3971 domain-containing protein [Nitratireductor mangrovi]|uniref:DUF3971 domain-containing protein n=1 Tax=Nitratireductor mangrovi TaxID=2599600 RepID=A0A5B8KZ06_9HYPH|nr:DUF3971 domain-containing protein [Nitratireductor mangrovi]QDZ00811.1 DUF3971 domain-containing protein [Nitratireductor mangrovi]
MAGLVAVLVGALNLAGYLGFGTDRLRVEASSAISAAVGSPVAVQSGRARFSLGGVGLVSLEIPDARLVAEASGAEVARVGVLRFGVEITALLSGRIAIKSLEIADARIAPDLLPGQGDRDPMAILRNADGMIDPDRVVSAAFDAVDAALSAYEARSTQSIILSDVVFELGGEGSGQMPLRIEEAEIRGAAHDQVSMRADLALLSNKLSVTGQASRSLGPRPGLSFRFETDFDFGALNTDTASDVFAVGGNGTMVVEGQRASVGSPDRISLLLNSSALTLSAAGVALVDGPATVRASLVGGSGKVEFEKISFSSGRSRFAFHGAVGPAPKGMGSGVPAYRYEFNSDGSRLAVSDVEEPSVSVLARLAGRFVPDARLLAFSEIGIRTSRGEVIGRGSIGFPDEGAPSIALAVDIPSMPVAHAKQIWPTIVAPGARSWVLGNMFGGTLMNSRVRFRVPPGRLGNGVPLSAEEVHGRFEVEDTRFDITGELPPVRDAFGAVAFRGNDVDVTLAAGTVYMPTGRAVAASNGTLHIDNSGNGPLIGAMEIDVAGDAPAIVELASYKPIDAMRHLRFVPTDFTGEVSGHVSADIPLQDDIPVDDLDWKVSLAYTGLALARPLDGQEVSEAEGTIVVDPDKAEISATARLNGIPATIEMTEPLASGALGRARDVTLLLDDAARQKIAPALNDMLSGEVKLAATGTEEGAQRMVADLTDARLTFPWVGWNKGPGIPATARFRLVQDGEMTRLADFRLEGKSFAIEGDVTLAGGTLTDARFPRVALNRGDDISVVVRQRKGRFDITVEGASLDARSIVKLYLSNTEQAEKTVEAIPVSVSANVARLGGFGGETLTGVDLDFASTGTDVGTMTLDATTSGGRKVTITKGGEGGSRTVGMRSSDAGSILRFLDIYEYMQGGTIDLTLAGSGNGPLRGQIDARDFWIVDEPKLRSIVATAPPNGDGRSLNEAVRADIDASKAQFQRGYATVEKGDGYLSVDRGILRGPVIGATFRGTLYDKKGNIAMTGTFMPAYGLNRIFGEIPLVGQILGNGRDRGLIGITFRLSGDASEPQLQVNPISVIAPGIFRSIFEFR